jgi:hypothetical protein
MYIGHRSRIGISAILAAGVAFGLASCSSHSVQGRGWLAGYHSEPEIGSRAYRSGGGEAPLGSSHVVASWYGPGYEGRRTASGDKFDPKHFSAASKTLPLGSIVRVTNLQNGRSVDVVIKHRSVTSRRATNRIDQKRYRSREDHPFERVIQNLALAPDLPSLSHCCGRIGLGKLP